MKRLIPSWQSDLADKLKEVLPKNNVDNVLEIYVSLLPNQYNWLYQGEKVVQLVSSHYV
jgi:hypothetical protein